MLLVWVVTEISSRRAMHVAYCHVLLFEVQHSRRLRQRDYGILRMILS
jgi:hypothetical protein